MEYFKMKLNSEPFSGFGKEAFYSVNTIKRMRLVGLGGVTDHIYIYYYILYIFIYINMVPSKEASRI